MLVNPCAFIPFGILLGTAFTGATISAWSGFRPPRPAARRLAPRPSAEIVYLWPRNDDGLALPRETKGPYRGLSTAHFAPGVNGQDAAPGRTVFRADCLLHIPF